MSVRLLMLTLIGALVCVRTLAYADPPDPTWIEGFWEDDDYDDVVFYTTSFSATETAPLCALPPHPPRGPRSPEPLPEHGRRSPAGVLTGSELVAFERQAHVCDRGGRCSDRVCPDNTQSGRGEQQCVDAWRPARRRTQALASWPSRSTGASSGCGAGRNLRPGRSTWRPCDRHPQPPG